MTDVVVMIDERRYQASPSSLWHVQIVAFASSSGPSNCTLSDIHTFEHGSSRQCQLPSHSISLVLIRTYYLPGNFHTLRPWEPHLATLYSLCHPMRPAGLRYLRRLASPVPTPFTRRTLPTRLPKQHSRAFQTSRRHRQQDDVIIVRKPWFTRRKFALALTQGLCIYTCWHFVIGKLDSVLDEVEDVEPEEGEDTSLFIPLSFPKVLPQEFYKSTDAEWQEFVKFSKDAKRKKGVRGRAMPSTIMA